MYISILFHSIIEDMFTFRRNYTVNYIVHVLSVRCFLLFFAICSSTMNLCHLTWQYYPKNHRLSIKTSTARHEKSFSWSLFELLARGVQETPGTLEAAALSCLLEFESNAQFLKTPCALDTGHEDTLHTGHRTWDIWAVSRNLLPEN